MTTQTKPLRPATDGSFSGTRLPWYRSFLVWVGIFITLITTGSIVTIVYIGHKYAVEQPPVSNLNAQGEKQLTHLLGMPLTHQHSIQPDEVQPDEVQHDEVQPSKDNKDSPDSAEQNNAEQP